MYTAVIIAVPGREPLKDVVHVAVAVVPERAQLAELNTPVIPVAENVTVPVGVVAPVVEESVTVAVQLVFWLTMTVAGVQLRVVAVPPVLPLTVIVVVPRSGPWVAVMVWVPVELGV